MTVSPPQQAEFHLKYPFTLTVMDGPDRFIFEQV